MMDAYSFLKSSFIHIGSGTLSYQHIYDYNTMLSLIDDGNIKAAESKYQQIYHDAKLCKLEERFLLQLEIWFKYLDYFKNTKQEIYAEASLNAIKRISDHVKLPNDNTTYPLLKNLNQEEKYKFLGLIGNTQLSTCPNATKYIPK